MGIEYANLFSRVTYHWVTPLLSKGFKKKSLTLEDLGDVPDKKSTDRLVEIFENNWKAELKRRPEK
jgi:hypothetical protein